MTYETVDNFLTLAITALLYGTGIWLVAAFTIFVATHDLDSSDSDRLSNSEPARPPASQEETPQQQTTITAEPQAASPIQTETSEKLSDDQVDIVPASAIALTSLDFSRLTVAQLRCPHLRKSYGILLRPKGQIRAYNKAELVALYRLSMMKAIASKEQAA